MAKTVQPTALPPKVPGLPLLGNTFAMTRRLMPFLVESYRTYGPLFRIEAGPQHYTVLAGPEANLFCTQNPAVLGSYDVWSPYGQEFGVPDYLQSADGPQHLALRKIQKQAFSATNMLNHLPQLMSIAREAIDHHPEHAPLSALQVFRSIVTEQLGVTLTGFSPKPYVDTIKTTIRFALNVKINKAWPAVFLQLPHYKAARQQFLALGKQIVREHQQTTRDEPDLVDAILQAQQDQDLHDFLGTEDQIAFSALGPFVAGLDTVSNECTFLLYELCQQPDLLQQCIEEADRLLRHPDQLAENLKQHGILHRAMMENLRLHSIAPVVTRTAARTFEFNNHVIQEGTSLMIATTVAHHLEEFYREPERFDPSRFDEIRHEHKQRGAYYPFGVGAHLCLGAGAAEVQMVVVMAALLHLRNVDRVGSGPLPVRLDPTPTLGDRFKISLQRRDVRSA